MRFLVITTALCLLCLTAPVAHAEYDENGDSDCPGNSCNAPPGQGGDSSSESSSESSANNSLTIGANDASDYPGTPASVYATRCTSGASVSFPGGGATATGNDKFCNRLALATFYATVLNDPDKAKALIVDAEERMNRSGRFFGISRFLHLDEWPLIGPFLFTN